MNATINIPQLRRLAVEGSPLREEWLALIEAVEGLAEAHEDECGCDHPGSFATCIWREGGSLLARFDFKEGYP